MESSNGKRTEKGVLKRVRERLLSLKSLLWFRISVFFVLGVTLPLIVFTAVATWHTGRTIYDQTTRYSAELVREISRNIHREIDSLQVISVGIAYSDAIQHLAANYEDLTSNEMRTALADSRLTIARQLTFRGEVRDVLLYRMDGGTAYLYGNFAIPFRLTQESEERLTQRAYDLTGRFALLPFGPSHQIPGIRLRQDIDSNSAECLMLVRAIRDTSDGSTLGVLAMRLDARFFNDSLRAINVGEGVQFVAFNNQGDTVLTTDEEMFTTGEQIPPELLDRLRARNNDLTYLDHNDQTYVIYKANITNAEWTIALLVPRENLDREIRTIYITFLLILGATLLLSVAVLQIFHRIFNRPMIRLVDAMNAADGGNLHVEIESTSADEVGQAVRSFNNMLSRIRNLLDDVKTEETAKHTAELAALQAQINPHFLSNTLGAARLMAQNQKADTIDQLLGALIDLLHVSMGVGDDLIPLHEEIKHVQSYVKIMQYRSYAEPDVQFYIQDEANDCLVPRLILQPLVENALIHGVSGKGQFGQISVRAVIDEDELCITVTDNGAGITPDLIDSILYAPPPDSVRRFSGVGLPNVHKRLQRSFGEGYGLLIDSIPDMYTTIDIYIPIIRAEGGDSDAR